MNLKHEIKSAETSNFIPVLKISEYYPHFILLEGLGGRSNEGNLSMKKFFLSPFNNGRLLLNINC